MLDVHDRATGRSGAVSRRHRSAAGRAGRRQAAPRLPGCDQLAAELADERERRRLIEGQLRDHVAQLEKLRAQVELLRHANRPAAGPPDVSAADTSRRTRLVEVPREPSDSGEAYWLRRCDGFLVEVDGELVGTVDEMRFVRRHDRPDALIVARGRSLLVVPVETVAEILPEQERITLSVDPRGKRHRTAASAGLDLTRTLFSRLRLFHAASS